MSESITIRMGHAIRPSVRYHEVVKVLSLILRKNSRMRSMLTIHSHVAIFLAGYEPFCVAGRDCW